MQSASRELVVESIDLQRVRPPRRSELVGSHLRGDRLYGEVVSSRGPTLAVRSEIGPYRRPSQRYLALPKIFRDATPMKSSFPSTDGASQVRRSERAADVCIPASAYPDEVTPSHALVQKKRLTSTVLSEHITWLAPSVEGKELCIGRSL